MSMDTFSQTQHDDGFFPQVGGVWTNYKILSEIGRGGMGIVYRAIETNPQRDVAIKLILNTSQELNRRFQREIEISANLNHPYITKVYNFKKCRNFLALIMEYIDGFSLGEYIKQNDLCIDDKIKIIIDVCEALEYAHKNNIIHRDLKPENILITENRKPKIIDFGIARQMNRKFDLTKTGEVMGTPNYMAPEQLRGKRSGIDQQCDIYAIGCILYEVIANEKMIKGKSIIQILFNIEHQKINSLRSIDNNISPDLDKIWKNAIARKKGERYKNITEMKEDLQKFLKGHSVKRNLPKSFYRNMFVVLLFTTVLLTLSYYYFSLPEKQINVEITEQEKKIIEEIENSNYYEAIHIYKNTNLINTNLIMRSISNCYAELKKIVVREIKNPNISEVQKYIHTILEKFPDDAEMLYFLSKTYLPPNKYGEAFNVQEYSKKENFRLAKQHLQKCIKIDPYNSEYFLLLGKLEFSKENYEISCKYLQRTLDLDRENTEALEFLYQIPYKNPKLQKDCYQYIIKSIDDLDNLSLYSLDLFAQKFKTLESEYHQYYLQYLTASKDHKEVDFLDWLQKIDLYEWDERLYSTLLVFRYQPTFEAQLQNLIENNSLDKTKQIFIAKLLKEAKEVKKQEYRNFYCYQMLYDYNRKSVNNVIWNSQIDSQLKQEMKDIILCTIKEENLWIKFVATQMYLEKYGFSALDTLLSLLNINTNIDTSINKIIIISVIKKQGLPIPNEISTDMKNLQHMQDEDMEFFQYLIASSTFSYHFYFSQDTFWRIDQKQLMPVKNDQKQLLQELLNSPFEKVRVKAAINLMFLLENDDTILLEEMIAQLKEIMLNPHKDVEIRLYIHYYFWSCHHIKHNLQEYKELYLMSLQDREDAVIKMVLAHHNNLSAFFGDDEIISKIKALLTSDIKNLQNARKTRLYIILTLGLSKITKYKDLKALLKNSPCSSFEQLYGHIIKIYSLFYHKNWKENANFLETLNEYIEDVKESEEAYFKCFNLYFCSFLQCHFIKKPYRNEDLLQNVLYQLYRGMSLETLSFFLPRQNQTERLNFAEKYLEHINPKIKYYALASYISLLQNEKERDEIFEKALVSDSYTKDAIAFGFYQALERIKMEKSDHNLGKIFETIPSEIYLNYVEGFTNFLISQYKNKKDHFFLYKKWLNNSYNLDPQNSKYIFEKGIFAHIENDYSESLRLINLAISKEPQNYTFLLTRAKVLYSQKNIKECVASLDMAIAEATSIVSLREIAKIYFDLKSYEKAYLIYDKIFTEHPFDKTDDYIYLVISYIRLNRKEDAIRILQFMNEIKKRMTYNKGKQGRNFNEQFFEKYTEDYPELKAIGKSWQKEY